MSDAQLCSSCQKLILDDWKLITELRTLDAGHTILTGICDERLEYERQDVYPDFPSLEATAQEGCHLCAQLRATFLRILGSHLEDHLQKSRNAARKAERQPIDSIGVTFKNFQFRHDSPSVYYGQPKNASYLLGFMYLQDPMEILPKGSFSGITLQVAAEQADDPTVGKLITQQAVVPYAALSYCWGDQSKYPPLETRPTTIRDRLKSIDIDQVPHTIRDAVIVTRRLGIQFLWVDALCIIQGDTKDWQDHVALLPAIYSNAWIVIAAALGDSSHSGFLQRDRTLNQISIPCNALKRRFGHSGKITLDMDSNLSYEWDYFRQEIDGSPWDRRAWTHQERTFARRVLFFGNRLYYQCQECSRIEDIPDRPVSPISLNFEIEERIYTLMKGSRSVTENYQHWRRLVQAYSERLLTYPSDKLAAISGVAQYLGQICNDENLAGLWRKNLQLDLLWTMKTRVSRDQDFIGTRWAKSQNKERLDLRNADYMAPTWTWASSDKPIRWISFCDGRTENLKTCAVVDISSTLKGANPMDALRGACIVLKGKSTLLDPSWISERTWIWRWDYADETPDPKAIKAFVVAEERREDRLACCMGRTRPPKTYTPVACGLLLEKTDFYNKREGAYRRVGMFKIAHRDRDILDSCAIETVTIV
ncbi:hypothetical protein PFICI_12660 [Pestalotiopsis fici W106-1]|uniref:Heterokaryon incompatibility domain-containing protein n=1 Tax=Pestalotiopsis fici (strain W106-1 / CGMCC3.15140) TaxID=1229662 RepID=W3WSA7_PESFW|nr:uncharacterized protein PFICI_12660 [Pestalotiopsis fici W106-1]ETS75716.1 hypothetical protein PFICI_12660 [Pestalotiopsis fici W106-1]